MWLLDGLEVARLVFAHHTLVSDVFAHSVRLDDR